MTLVFCSKALEAPHFKERSPPQKHGNLKLLLQSPKLKLKALLWNLKSNVLSMKNLNLWGNAEDSEGEATYREVKLSERALIMFSDIVLQPHSGQRNVRPFYTAVSVTAISTSQHCMYDQYHGPLLHPTHLRQSMVGSQISIELILLRYYVQRYVIKAFKANHARKYVSPMSTQGDVLSICLGICNTGYQE